MTDKYELTDNVRVVNGHTLHQIKALKDFGDVWKGYLGGWIESQDNLSQTGLAWVYDNAKVYGYARVYDNAKVYGNARIYDYAHIYGYAHVYDYAQIYGSAHVWGNTTVSGNAQVYGNSDIQGSIDIRENDKTNDNKSYLVFNDTWSSGGRSGQQFVYVLSNQRWHVDCFDGTGEELIKKAYQDSELSGKMYEMYVHFAEQVVETRQND